ncbi:MAG TPA: hypothetical protein ENJ82_04580 [Bacteroidetes bacterium]|nr:hypothetical protein [Bacteroidota bacterium]
MLSIKITLARQLLALIVMLFSVLLLPAQLLQEGPFCGKQYYSDLSNGGQHDWGNALKARCDEDESHTYTAQLNKGSYSHYLHIENFGFSIPAHAKISGIEVVIIRRSDHGGALQDHSVHLVKKGQVMGKNMAYPTLWEDSWTGVFYGGKHELWGQNWSAKDLNNAKFGVVLAVKYDTGEGRAEVDEVLLTVHYTEPKQRIHATKSIGSLSKFTCYSVGS